MRHRNFAAESIFKSLCIVVSTDTAQENFSLIRTICALFKHRFGVGVRIAFVSNSPSEFGTEEIESAITQSEIDHFYFSGDDLYLTVDAVMAARRMACKYTFFLTTEILISETTSILKFLNESNFSETTISLHEKYRMFLCTTQTLANLPISKLNSWNQLLVEICELVFNINPHRIFIETEVYGRHTRLSNEKLRSERSQRTLFLTSAGVIRLGGEQFFKSKIRYAGIPITDFNEYWLISALEIISKELEELRSKSRVRINTGVKLLPNGLTIIYDINPGFSNFDLPSSLINEIDVPRQILSVRALAAIENNNLKQNINFIVSNFNKSKYIYSSLYSMMMQTCEQCKIHFVDDLSTDNSIEYARYFKIHFKISDALFSISINENRKGTYWIRNNILHHYCSIESYYLINDSDDYSVAQRAHIQFNQISSNKESDTCFGDIIRVDSQFNLIQIDEHIERYGTASFGGHANIYKEFGYFQNLRKNADTEFIERIRHFAGKKRILWFRYPVLFQAYDGSNLTADIYKIDSTTQKIKQNLNARSTHVEAYKADHLKIDRKNLVKINKFDKTELSDEYNKIDSSFLMPKDSSTEEKINFHLVAYINLDDRIDRRKHMESQLSRCQWPVHRISATRLQGTPEDHNIKMLPRLIGKTGVASIWLSHKHALENFINYSTKNNNVDNSSYLLLEDDVWIKSEIIHATNFKLPLHTPADWEILLLSPKYRLRRKTVLLNDNVPYFAENPPHGSILNLGLLLERYIITGAHFCVFRSIEVINKVLDRMKVTTALYDVDAFYVDNFKIYGIHNKYITTGNFGSDHN